MISVDEQNMKNAVVIKRFLKVQQWVHYWSRYKIIIALLIAVLLCTGIYFLGN